MNHIHANIQCFSVAMCVYGGDDPAWFHRAVSSVREQTVPPDEIVIVADGPVPDGIEEILAECEKCEVFRIIRLAENRGHGEARRVGIDACSHELVALMDSDDVSAADRFERQLWAFAKDESLSIVGGNITEFCGDEENIVGRRNVPESDREIKEYMKRRCPMNQVTVMFKKSHILNAGGYLDWYCEEDYYLWLRMSLAGMRFANIPKVLCNVRVGEDMYRRRGGVKYFLSEAKLQKYMLEKRIISAPTYAVNVLKRLIVQVLLPNRLRGWVFQKFAREQGGE